MTKSDWKLGGCFCGYVRYRVRGPAIWKAGCTCTTCVKMHAAPYVVWAGFDVSDFELAEGKPKQFQSSNHVVREFCGQCGATLTYRKVANGIAELEAAARLVYVAVASLDNPAEYPPDEVVHGAERIGWLNLDDTIPMRVFISPDAGELQFCALDQTSKASVAKSRFGYDGDG